MACKRARGFLMSCLLWLPLPPSTSSSSPPRWLTLQVQPIPVGPSSSSGGRWLAFRRPHRSPTRMKSLRSTSSFPAASAMRPSPKCIAGSSLRCRCSLMGSIRKIALSRACSSPVAVMCSVPSISKAVVSRAALYVGGRAIKTNNAKQVRLSMLQARALEHNALFVPRKASSTRYGASVPANMILPSQRAGSTRHRSSLKRRRKGWKR